MKYCSNCGNAMQDDMLFCQKCGTKFDTEFNNINNSEYTKISKMKSYNLCLDSDVITWKLIQDDGKYSANLVSKQDKICTEFCEVISDILSKITDDTRNILEDEVYIYVLKMGIDMCENSKEMLENYSGYKELFDEGKKLNFKGQLDDNEFLDDMANMDLMYKTVAHLQGVHAVRIKKILDKEVISNNEKYINLLSRFAQCYNDMWYALVKRFTDFYLVPGKDLFTQSWENYCELIDGLSQSIVDTLDESGWSYILNYLAKHHGANQFRIDFIKERDSLRDCKRLEEKAEADKKYWILHPTEYERKLLLEQEIKKAQEIVEETKNQQMEIVNKKWNTEDEIYRLQNEIDDKQKSIERLKKKIWGKRKAQEEIIDLEKTISSLRTQEEMEKNRLFNLKSPLKNVQFSLEK